MKNITEIQDINEFLVTFAAIALCGVLGGSALINARNRIINARKEFLEKKREIQKIKDEKLREKEERKIKKEKEKREREHEEKQNEALRSIAAFKFQVLNMEDNKEKAKMMKVVDTYDRMIKGNMSDGEIEELQKDLNERKSKMTQKEIEEAEKVVKQTPKEEIDKEVETLKENIKKAEKEIEDKTDTNDKGETIKKEEVTDPKTGKKTTQTIHTGPRGGRYYWPEGEAHNDDNKVYVESVGIISLKEFLKMQ